MDKVLYIMLMDVNMKDNGQMIKNMDKVLYIMLMETNM